MKHMKRIICALVTLALMSCLCAAPVSAAEEGWKDAYRSAVSKYTKKYGSVCQLADFNLDGTPELLIGNESGGGYFSMPEYCFTFRDGAAVEISFDEFMEMGRSYELYRNDSTGEIRIEGTYNLRASYNTYTIVTASYSFDGAALTYSGHFGDFGSGKSGGKDVYYVNGESVSASAYSSAYGSRNNGWTKIDFPVSYLSIYKSINSTELDNFLNGFSGSPVLAVPGANSIQVNGAPVSAAAYNIGGNNYFKLRDLAMLLKDTGSKFEVGYDSAAKSITLTTSQPYTAVGGELSAGATANQLGVQTPSAIYIDGKSVELTGYNIGGNNYFKLRDLGEALRFDVGWDNATRTVSITAEG